MDSCLQKTLDAIQSATEGMTTEQLAWHPHGKWSSAEILEHLTLAFSGTVKGMQRVLAGNGNGTQKRTLKNRLFVFIVVDLGHMPSGRKAPSMTVPSGANAADPVGTILSNLRAMDEILDDVVRRKGPRTRVTHPILGPLTISQWKKFHMVHTRHHMKQIARLRELAS